MREVELQTAHEPPPMIAAAPIDDTPDAMSSPGYPGPGGGSLDAMVAAFHHYVDDLVDPVRPRKRDKKPEKRPREPVEPRLVRPYERNDRDKLHTGPKLGGDYEVTTTPFADLF